MIQTKKIKNQSFWNVQKLPSSFENVQSPTVAIVLVNGKIRRKWKQASNRSVKADQVAATPPAIEIVVSARSDLGVAIVLKAKRDQREDTTTSHAREAGIGGEKFREADRKAKNDQKDEIALAVDMTPAIALEAAVAAGARRDLKVVIDQEAKSGRKSVGMSPAIKNALGAEIEVAERRNPRAGIDLKVVKNQKRKKDHQAKIFQAMMIILAAEIAAIAKKNQRAETNLPVKSNQKRKIVLLQVAQVKMSRGGEGEVATKRSRKVKSRRERRSRRRKRSLPVKILTATDLPVKIVRSKSARTDPNTAGLPAEIRPAKESALGVEIVGVEKNREAEIGRGVKNDLSEEIVLVAETGKRKSIPRRIALEAKAGITRAVKNAPKGRIAANRGADRVRLPVRSRVAREPSR